MRARSVGREGAPVVLTRRADPGVRRRAPAVAGLLTGLVPAFQAGRTDVAGGTQVRVARRNVCTVRDCASRCSSLKRAVGRSPRRRGLFRTKSDQRAEHTVSATTSTRSCWGRAQDARREARQRDQQLALRRRLLEVARTMPGVEHASLQAAASRSGRRGASALFVDGIDSVQARTTSRCNADSPSSSKRWARDSCADAALTDRDYDNWPKVMVVSEKMGEALWPGQDPHRPVHPRQRRHDAVHARSSESRKTSGRKARV